MNVNVLAARFSRVTLTGFLLLVCCANTLGQTSKRELHGLMMELL
jgi:hypothetical protein